MLNLTRQRISGQLKLRSRDSAAELMARAVPSDRAKISGRPESGERSH
jgi:hypothetical protein